MFSMPYRAYLCPHLHPRVYATIEECDPTISRVYRTSLSNTCLCSITPSVHYLDGKSLCQICFEFIKPISLWLRRKSFFQNLLIFWIKSDEPPLLWRTSYLFVSEHLAGTINCRISVSISPVIQGSSVGGSTLVVNNLPVVRVRPADQGEVRRSVYSSVWVELRIGVRADVLYSLFLPQHLVAQRKHLTERYKSVISLLGALSASIRRCCSVLQEDPSPEQGRRIPDNNFLSRIRRQHTKFPQ